MLTFLSLGAGVQSSTLALMAASGEVAPMPDAAIFADTQAEPKAVYDWLDWLETQLPYPVYRVTAGNLTEESLNIRVSKRSGLPYLGHTIPAFTLALGESKGQYRRQCTDKHKLTPFRREVNRLRGSDTCTVWIGISYDETQRMKESIYPEIIHQWPLIERRITRQDCLDWMSTHGFPTPPRSACVYCPYHSDEEWRKLRESDPDAWQAAVDYERLLQEAALRVPRLKSIPFLHPKRVPLADFDFEGPSVVVGPRWNTMQNECEGMCGV